MPVLAHLVQRRWRALPAIAGLLLLATPSCRLFDPPAIAQKAMADMPIKKVVLDQNGVGYFERRGKTNLESVELRVRPDQVNDVLKSLAVLDLAGGAASSISLGTTGAVRGDMVVFTADGSANGHTVTYKDGSTAISAAATASKRHTAICFFDGAAWTCALSVGP